MWPGQSAEVAEAESEELWLLRRFEPVLAYTRGERFFPTDVDGYVRQCSLWRDTAGRGEEEVVPAGQLTLDRLAGARGEWPGTRLHLRFVQKATLREEAQQWRATSMIARTGRLAAVGLMTRVLDVLMRISLLVRGKVPVGLAAAAATRYRERLDEGHCTYYGRVSRDGGYVVLQYWFFYAMNDWRSTFGGVNDHEADWEMVTVYLATAEDGEPRPAWVGISSHEYTGDDLRRRWDDPDLHREGEHPVVFVGAGSHSGQVLPGDYLIAVDPASLRGAIAFSRRLKERLFPWTRRAGAGRRGIGIPFVDYARGDGRRVGPGGDRPWHPVVIDDSTPWVVGFRGLWGRDTRDWLDGERAPTGPRYERDGRVRFAWRDPLGWTGLQKVAPDPAADRRTLANQVERLEQEVAEADKEIAGKREEVRRLSALAASLERYPHTRERGRELRAEVDAAERALAAVYEHRAGLAEERAVHLAALEAVPGGVPAGEPQAHLKAPHVPYAVGHQRYTRFLRIWAALSTPLLILAFAVILAVPGPTPLATLAGVVLAFAAIEAIARGKLLGFLTALATLAVIAGVLAGVVFAFMLNWRVALLIPLFLAVVLLLVVNVRDLLSK
ncbi:hypothetical protein [Allonocardiopsis opalescens]|uniref:hypothetical protein n=1 Tax=Allonocardiopsis opalescens TaxID=1144618 RepID=UPI001FE6BBA1|nr:hypothetical protein [Allonocardiopsis opalescens]